MKILVAEFRKMFPGDHGKPCTEALYNYMIYDNVADGDNANDDGDHENDYVGSR